MATRYIARDIKGQLYLTTVLGLSDEEMSYHCLEKCTVDSVDFYNNTLTITSIQDGMEYQGVEHICHTDVGYYSFGIAGQQFTADASFNHSARCFIYDNGGNYVFGFIRTDPDTGIKTATCSFPCLQRTDRINGTVYGNCNVDAMNKTLQVVAGRTYWPYMAVYVDVNGTKHCLTVLDLHHGTEATVINNNANGKVSFPCLATEIQRHLDHRVQTWPDEALNPDWVSWESKGCSEAYTDAEQIEVWGPVSDPESGETRYLEDIKYTCSAPSSVDPHSDGYYRDTNRSHALPTTLITGAPVYYYLAYGENWRDQIYQGWTIVNPPGGINGMPGAMYFTNLILGDELDNFKVSLTNNVHNRTDYHTWGYHPYQDHHNIHDAEESSSFHFSGRNLDYSITAVGEVTTKNEGRSYWADPSMNWAYESDSTDETDHYAFPTLWQQQKPNPCTIYLFERWYGFLDNHVFVHQQVDRRRDYDNDLPGWGDWSYTYSSFSVKDVVPQLYLAFKQDDEDDSTQQYCDVDKVKAMADVIAARTRTFISNQGFSDAAEMMAAIDQESANTGCDLYYAKYDLLTRKYGG